MERDEWIPPDCFGFQLDNERVLARQRQRESEVGGGVSTPWWVSILGILFHVEDSLRVGGCMMYCVALLIGLIKIGLSKGSGSWKRLHVCPISVIFQCYIYTKLWVGGGMESCSRYILQKNTTNFITC